MNSETDYIPGEWSPQVIKYANEISHGVAEYMMQEQEKINSLIYADLNRNYSYRNILCIFLLAVIGISGGVFIASDLTFAAQVSVSIVFYSYAVLVYSLTYEAWSPEIMLFPYVLTRREVVLDDIDVFTLKKISLLAKMRRQDAMIKKRDKIIISLNVHLRLAMYSIIAAAMVYIFISLIHGF